MFLQRGQSRISARFGTLLDEVMFTLGLLFSACRAALVQQHLYEERVRPLYSVIPFWHKLQSYPSTYEIANNTVLAALNAMRRMKLGRIS